MKQLSALRTNVVVMAVIVLTLCGPCLSQAALVVAWGDNTYGETQLPVGVSNVKAIAGGDHHGVALRSDGSVVAWGLNNQGQINVPSGLANVKAIAAGSLHSLALKVNGSVVAWGSSHFGQTKVPDALSRVVAVASRGNHNLALSADGTVIAWGDNSNGETNVPGDLADAIAIAAGANHSLALKANGSVVAWGNNSYGQTNIPLDLSNVVAIAAGSFFNVALKADGIVVAWGENYSGQANVPVGLSNVTAITAGSSHAMALRADGTIVAWGDNFHGQSALPSGLSNVTAVAAGGNQSLALVPIGPVQILQNPQSQGISYTSNVTFTVLATGFDPLGYQWLFNGSPIGSSNLRASGATSATLAITNLQFSDIGTYSVVVSNAFGSVISLGAALTVISPPFITQQPTDRSVRAGSDVTLSASASGTPPLSSQWNFNGVEIPGATEPTFTLFNVQPANSGLYYMRVTNIYGAAQTMRAALIVTDSPPYFLRQTYVRRPDQSTVTNLVAPVGGAVTIAVDARGSAPLFYQWKLNGLALPGATNATLTLSNLQFNQAGYYNVEVNNAAGLTNSAKFLLNVAQVLIAGTPFVNNPNTPLGLSNIVAVAAGASQVMALRSDGTVRTWLANFGFIFGRANAVTNIPATATNIMAIAAGYEHCLALRSNGTVVAWGFGPTNPPAGLSNVISIAAGNSRSYAVKADGTITSWGELPPVGLTNVVAVSAGLSQNLALRRDGTVAMWSGGSSIFSVVSGLSNAIAIATSSTGNRALREDGTVVHWPLFSPSQPVGLDGGQATSNAVALALGATGVGMILQQDGTLLTAGILPPDTTNITAIAAGGVQSGFGVLVTGNGTPHFTLHPYTQFAQKSNLVKLHARAAGIQPMRYQWQLDGADLAGATNPDLTISNALGGDIGGYRCVAVNSLGMNASAVAQLTMAYAGTLAAALNATDLKWTTSLQGQDSGPPWFAQIRETHDGDAAAQSGLITHGQQSGLQTTINGPGKLSFWWKVSSEEGFDFLRVFVDQSPTPWLSISGETGWEQHTIAFTNGTHQVRWVYSKDVSVSAGRDAGWVDEVAFTPAPPTAYIQPASQTVSAGAQAVFFAVTVSPSKPVTYQWLRSGTNIAGATNQTLSLATVGRQDRGGYAVTVSNAGGGVLTSNATLWVSIRQRLGSLQRGADGSVAIFARDADDGALSAPDLPAFEAQVSNDLAHWQELPNPLTLTNGSLLLRDPGAPLWPQRFYRIVEH